MRTVFPAWSLGVPVSHHVCCEHSIPICQFICTKYHLPISVTYSRLHPKRFCVSNKEIDCVLSLVIGLVSCNKKYVYPQRREDLAQEEKKIPMCQSEVASQMHLTASPYFYSALPMKKKPPGSETPFAVCTFQTWFLTSDRPSKSKKNKRSKVHAPKEYRPVMFTGYLGKET